MAKEIKTSTALPGKDTESIRIREVALHAALRFCDGLPVTIETLIGHAENMADFMQFGDVPIVYKSSAPEVKPFKKKK